MAFTVTVLPPRTDLKEIGTPNTPRLLKSRRLTVTEYMKALEVAVALSL
jgi:hypothetical protein